MHIFETAQMLSMINTAHCHMYCRKPFIEPIFDGNARNCDTYAFIVALEYDGKCCSQAMGSLLPVHNNSPYSHLLVCLHLLS